MRDSYADCLAPFLRMEQYSEIHLFDARYFKQPLSSYIAQHDIDETVLLFSLEEFYRRYQPDNGLQVTESLPVSREGSCFTENSCCDILKIKHYR